ncbi:putative peripheral membrane protein [Pisolithus thermaeus]|nr:putative peripheral membrane protein [Pisolithus thermaeus]
MSSWYPSWFSGFPARRFFSFALKKALGRFLKPGQLDLHQIDSQLGSGAVHVTDLELDEQAINELLVGLPFRLHDGFISGVTAHVPFPNPLTSSVGLHVRSLRLTLLVTEQRTSPPISPYSTNTGLSDSVLSVAESFVHRELTPREEATLRESLQPKLIPQAEVDEIENVPGGFDHSSAQHLADEMGRNMDGTVRPDGEPAGVSVFATFIEHLLSRFSFSALDTKITIVHAEKSSFTLTIPEDAGVTEPSPHVESPTISPTSVCSISPRRDEEHRGNVLSRKSSSSSLDDETQMMMSQSIAMLPPRPPSSASSTSSDMYQSVMSTGTPAATEYHRSMEPATPSPSSCSTTPELDSFGVLSTTPSAPSHVGGVCSGDEALSAAPDEARHPIHESPETLSLTVSAGTVACALRACHIRMLMDLVNACGLDSSPPVSHIEQTSRPSKIVTLGLSASLKIRGIVIILLSEPCDGRSYPLSPYFEHPFIPPRLSCAYVRLLHDNITGYFHLPPLTPSSNSLSAATSNNKGPPTSITASISDMSLFAFHGLPAAGDAQVAAPIMITDRDLSFLERATHDRPSFNSDRPPSMHLPLFDVVDWTQEKYNGNSTRLSTWRTKLVNRTGRIRSPAYKLRDLPSPPNPFVDTSPQTPDAGGLHTSAIEVTGCLSTSETSSLHVGVVPLHFFVDFGMFLDGGLLLCFVNEASSAPTLNLCLSCPMIRTEVRCTPLPGRRPRSGCLLLDIHEIWVHNNPVSSKPSIRFSESLQPLRRPNGMCSVQAQEILIAYAPVDDARAKTLVILGYMPESAGNVHTNVLPVHLLLARTNVSSREGGTLPSRLSLTVNVPLIDMILEKEIFDGLQCWVDDVAQLFDRCMKPLLLKIAARSDRPRTNGGEIVVKVNVTEALLRILLPRSDQNTYDPRPFDIQVSDINALIEMKPDGKDQTIITTSIMDLRVVDTTDAGNYVPLVVLAAPRTLSTVPKPMIKIRITSLLVPETSAKESKIKLALCGITCHVPANPCFAADLAAFAKAPPGVFESVVPSERTVFSATVVDVSLVGNSLETGFKLGISALHLFVIDNIEDASEASESPRKPRRPGPRMWNDLGYASVADVANCHLSFRCDNSVLPPDTYVTIDRIGLRIYLCADTLGAFTGFLSHLAPNAKDDETDGCCEGSLDENAFRRVPEVGSIADMINDDLPANPDYLDASFGTAAGLRELRDDDLEDFNTEEQSGRTTPVPGETGVVSNVGGETVRIFKRFTFTEHYFDTIVPDTSETTSHLDTTLRVRVHDADVTLFLHDGYDWPRTRKIIEKEIREMRKKLARIRQLVATGQTQEPIEEDTCAMLFNSIHIGLEQDLENMDPDTLLAAIDHELDEAVETGTEGSWQSLHPASPGKPRVPITRVHGKHLMRSKGPSIEIHFSGMNVEMDSYRPGETMLSRTLILAKDVEILDHIKTSTWKKFLTSLRADSRGNVRETGSNMARVELVTVRPSPYHATKEARLRAKFLPLRLYVDQDALDFLKKFFAFNDPESPAAPNDASNNEEIYFQYAEVFPVDIKLDYKPRRVDYRALREGRTIELMNFFHFDGAEMTLRRLTLHGVCAWPLRVYYWMVALLRYLNDLWTPDVKATQLVDVISGVAPIRSVVNVGSGVADLTGRILRGIQKGTRAFVQSTAMETIKLGARLATGTQVILEETENVLGGQFRNPVTAETLQIPYDSDTTDDDQEDLISRYAAQPSGVTEGVQSAYRSLRKGVHSAAQTILAVPMEVYERSGNEGAMRAVVRAVPIAVLKPMIGATEAVSKTLMGLHNTLDPDVRHENEAKYKHR